MEIDLTEVERLAWESLVREQQEAQGYTREIAEALTILSGRCPRVAADLVGLNRTLAAEHVARAKTLSAAIAVAHDVTPPTVAPTLVVSDGPGVARLTWPDPEPEKAETPALMPDGKYAPKGVPVINGSVRREDVGKPMGRILHSAPKPEAPRETSSECPVAVESAAS